METSNERSGEESRVVSVAENTNTVPVASQPANQNMSVPVSILCAGVIIALAIVYSNGGLKSSGVGSTPPPPAATAPQGNQVVDVKSLYTEKDPMLGNPDAPVTIIEFADFQCPFCGKFFKETTPKIIDDYVKTGKVKFIYKHFAFLGEESNWAAEAAECAGDQGKFWDYHDFLFSYIWDNYYATGKPGENAGVFSKVNLKKHAKTLGLETVSFNSCLDSGKYTDKVAKDTEIGRANGITGTPSTFVNGKLLVGAQPYAQFSSLIDAALNSK